MTRTDPSWTRALRPARSLWWRVSGAAAAVLAVAVAMAPASTKQGVDFRVSSHRIPLYVKTLDFLQRDAHYALLAREITRQLATDEQRMAAVYAWTREHVRPTPPGWPVVDDHILNIIIRGHGVSDQMADVATTLLTYAGTPAFWAWRLVEGGQAGPAVSFVRVDGRWVVVDVARGVVFRDAEQQLATLDALLERPELIKAQIGERAPGGRAYAAYLRQFTPFTVPRPLRAELQMVWPRLWYETIRPFTRLTRKQENDSHV